MSCLNDDLADGFLPSLKIHKIHGGLNINILQLKRKILYKKIIAIMWVVDVNENQVVKQ